MLIKPSPQTLDVMDTCTVLNHFFAISGLILASIPWNYLAFSDGTV